jgi:iron complex outermembrane receptor protein
MPRFLPIPARFLAAALLLLPFAPLPAQDDEGALDSLLRSPITSTLSTPVATASRAAEMAQDAPSSVTIITAADIRKFGYRTFDELLNRIPGFYLTYDRSYTYAGVRGFGRPSDYNNRILLLINGHLMNESFYGSSQLGSDFGLDLGIIDRVEIVRGPGSTLYGGGAMLAVVNVITRNGGEGTAGQVTATAGSYGRTGVAAQYGTAVGDALRFFIAGQWSDMKGQSLSFPEYDTDSTLHGVADRLDHEKTGGVFAAVAVGPVQLQGSFAKRRYGMPTGAYGAVFGDPRNISEDSKGFLELSTEFSPLPSLAVLVRGFYDYYRFEGEYMYDTPYYDATAVSSTGGEMHAVWDPVAENRLIAGVEVNRHLRSTYYGEGVNGMVTDIDYPFTVASLFADDMLHLRDNLSLSLGVRYDHYSDLGSFASPRAALVWSPGSAGTFKLLAEQAFRMPNRYERYYADSISGFLANPDLDPERITMLEAAFERKVTDGVYLTLSVFHYRMEDLIDQEENAEDGTVRYVNKGTLESSGLEIAYHAQPLPWLSGYANMTLQFPHENGSRIVDGERVSVSRDSTVNSPRRLFRAGCAFDFGGGLQCFTETSAESSRDTYEPGIGTAPFWLLHAGLSYRPRFPEGAGGAASLLSRLELSAVCRNLLDAAYAHPAGYEFVQHAIPQNGRNVLFSLTMHL